LELTVWQRVRLELLDLLELVLLPGLAAVLPWPWCFALFKRMARWQWLYRAECESALRQARQRGWSGVDEVHWLWGRRLVTLVDHADLYLVKTRTDAWVKRYFGIEGTWPVPDHAALLCTFHWGAGMWSLRHAASAGLKIHALVAPLEGAQFAGRRVLHGYAKARISTVASILGHPTLDVSANMRPALRALKEKDQLLAVVDVPADHVSATQEIQLLGMKARVPRALFRFAVEQAIPVTVFLVGLRTDDGQRILRLLSLGVYQEVDALICDVYVELERVIAEFPAAWHFWGESERIFETVESGVPVKPGTQE
jgi:hypothetical protein